MLTLKSKDSPYWAFASAILVVVAPKLPKVTPELVASKISPPRALLSEFIAISFVVFLYSP